MTRFSAKTEATAVVKATRQEIWDLLVTVGFLAHRNHHLGYLGYQGSWETLVI